MDAKRFEQIEKLYNAAITCQSEERSAMLDQADPEVRREVELMLAQQGSALDRPAWEGVPKSTVSGAIPRRLVERYEIEGKLGEGGMGVVYRALDTKLNRPVAIKFLSDDLADAAARHRFQREAQTASSLNHPHILTVYDAGEFDGRQYLVTEFVDGGAQDLDPIRQTYLAPDYRTARRPRGRSGRGPRGRNSASRHQAR
jgi:hypothetical protein